MNPWPWLWGAWVVLGIALEIVAISQRASDDTLSEQVWNLQDWLKGRGKIGTGARVAFVVGLLGFLAWLGLHLVLPGTV